MQAQPKTVLAALLPSPVRVGGGRLLPVTLGGAAMLHCIKSPFVDEGEPSKLEVFTAGYILSKPWDKIVSEHQDGVLGENALNWSKKNKIDLDDLCHAVAAVIRSGFASAAKTRFPVEKEEQIVQVVPSPFGNGLGYLMTMVETLMFNYKWTMKETLRLPLTTAFALITSRRINEGAEFDGEPSYMERDNDFDGIKAYLDNMKF